MMAGRFEATDGTSTSMNETTDATAIFAPIWRRKWLILAVAIVVGAASYFYYKRQTATYQSTTQVFLGAGAEEQAPGEKVAKGRNTLSDQAAVINTIVVEQVRHRLRAEHKGKLAARSTKVKAKAPEKSEFITITAEGHSAKGVALLANLTAQAYIARRKDNRQRAVEKAIAISRRQLKRIEQSALASAEKSTPASKGKKGSAAGGANASSKGSGGQSASSVIQEANLSSNINKLEASLGTVSAQQVREARPANALLLSPKPRKDAIFGFVLGLVLAAIAAYAFSRFDRRLRSLAAIESVTRLPLLTVLPKVRRPIIRGAGSPRPSVHLLEPLRGLHTSLHAVNGGAGSTSHLGSGRSTLVVSPDPGDGKSTLIADLALVQRDAGARVVIVEANFRRPVQMRLLGLEGEGRLADVLGGRITAEEAMQRVSPALVGGAPDGGDQPHAVATAVQAEVGSLFVLGGDRNVQNPPALLAQASMPELLRYLAARFDSVLIDAPSPLEVSDAVSLLGVTDGIVVVERVGHSREASARRLSQLLDKPSVAPVLGVVANFVARGEVKRYGFSPLRSSRGRSGAELARR
jgi:Mrp family chromosome partitioning ATPase/capsular polysaccharide biosynthesis protein